MRHLVFILTLILVATASACGSSNEPDGATDSSVDSAPDSAPDAPPGDTGLDSAPDGGPFCGDGEVEGDEVCDDGPDNSDDWTIDAHCNSTCTGLGPHCGDATVDPMEACDGDGTTCTGEAVCDACACTHPACTSVETPLVEVGRIGLPARPYDMALVGDLLYVSAGMEGFHVVDVSDVTTPVAVGNLDLGTFTGIVEAVADHAYVAASGGVQVIDVSDPAMPVAGGTLLTGGGAIEAMHNAGGTLYAHAGSRLSVVDVSSPATPAGITTTILPGRHVAFTALGDNLFGVTNTGIVTTDTSGLDVTDISDPSMPSVGVGAVTTPGDPRAVVVEGDYAYVADGVDAGLTIIDISDPTMPSIAGTLPVGSGAANGIDVAGDFVALATSSDDMHVIDVSDRTAPALADSFPTGFLFSVVIRGNLAFVGDDGVAVVRLCSR